MHCTFVNIFHFWKKWWKKSWNRSLGVITEENGTVYPKKYAHGFVVLCFVVVMQSFRLNSHEVFIHIHHGCFAGTGAIVRLPQCQWSKPDGYGKISQCITTTKHSKAKTVCIFLGIYCMYFVIVMENVMKMSYKTFMLSHRESPMPLQVTEQSHWQSLHFNALHCIRSPQTILISTRKIGKNIWGSQHYSAYVLNLKSAGISAINSLIITIDFWRPFQYCTKCLIVRSSSHGSFENHFKKGLITLKHDRPPSNSTGEALVQ